MLDTQQLWLSPDKMIVLALFCKACSTTLARAAGPAIGAMLWSVSDAYMPMLVGLAAIGAIGAATYWAATREADAS